MKKLGLFFISGIWFFSVCCVTAQVEFGIHPDYTLYDIRPPTFEPWGGTGGADFFICPDNTAHIVLEKIVSKLPIPGLHIAEVVCQEINSIGWKNVGLLGTKWTMTGPVYSNALKNKNLVKIIPNESVRNEVNRAIFEELCQEVFEPKTIEMFLDAISDLKREGAECVILGCTEIPLVVTPGNSPLPILDSTRLLAKSAVRLAISEEKLINTGWINPAF